MAEGFFIFTGDLACQLPEHYACADSHVERVLGAVLGYLNAGV